MRLPIKRNIDFFEQIRSDSEINSRPDKRMPLILPFGAAILLVLISWGIFSWLNFDAEQRLSAIGASLSGVTESAGASNGLSASVIEDMLQMELDYNNSNRITSGRLKELYMLQPDDLSVLGVVYSDDLITIDCWSGRELCGADFAKLLRESGAFSDVNYNGVTASGGGYSFSISFYCTGETGDTQ